MSKKVFKNVVNKKDKRILIAVNDEEDAQIQAKADEFADGNVSLWVRKASINYVPKNSELEKS